MSRSLLDAREAIHASVTSLVRGSSNPARDWASFKAGLDTLEAERDRYLVALTRIAEGTECSIGLGAASKHGDTFCAYHVAREALNG